jgi:peptide/nickel transport system substrate-binding protein
MAAVAAVLLLSLSSAPALAEDEASPAGGAEPLTLRVGWTNDLGSPNPFLGLISPSDFEVYQLTYDWLVGFDAATLDPVPALATEWSVSDDQLVWTFKLREGVKWTDGEPFTADDVAFTINLIVEQGANSYSSNVLFIEKATVIDDSTVEIACTDPKADMLASTIFILPEHIWSKVDMEEAFTTYENPVPHVGTGPFQAVEWKRGKYLRMKANKDYWGGAPNVDELLFSYYTNAESMVFDLESGKQDVIVNVPEAQFEKLGEKKGITTIAADQGFVESVYLNCSQDPTSKGHPVLRDPAFRRALNYAIDREQIAAVAYSGLAGPGSSLFPPDYTAFPWHWDPGAKAYPFDLEMANAKLDEAGYADSDGDGIREADGKSIELGLLTRAQVPAEQRAGKQIAGWFEEIGIEVDLSAVDEGIYLDRIYAVDGDGNLAPDFDMVIWYVGGTPDPGYLVGMETTDNIGYWGVTYWADKDYDGMWYQQATTLDAEARKPIVWDMQKKIYDDSPLISIAYPALLQAYRSDAWTGWIRSPRTGGVVMTWFNNDSYIKVRPKAASAATDSGSSSSWVLPTVLGFVGVLVVAGVVIVVVRRRGARSVEE